MFKKLIFSLFNQKVRGDTTLDDVKATIVSNEALPQVFVLKQHLALTQKP